MSRWILGVLTTAAILVLPASAQRQLDPCKGRFNSTYDQILDAYFTTLFRYSPAKSIWDKYNDWLSANPRRTLNAYVSRAKKISFRKQESDVSESDFNDLIARTKALNLTTCGLEPTVKTDGSQVLVLDAPIFEVILEAGKIRAGVLNTSGDDVVSPNPDLLKWSLDVREHVSPTK